MRGSVARPSVSSRDHSASAAAHPATPPPSSPAASLHGWRRDPHIGRAALSEARRTPTSRASPWPSSPPSRTRRTLPRWSHRRSAQQHHFLRTILRPRVVAAIYLHYLPTLCAVRAFLDTAAVMCASSTVRASSSTAAPQLPKCVRRHTLPASPPLTLARRLHTVHNQLDQPRTQLLIQAMI